MTATTAHEGQALELVEEKTGSAEYRVETGMTAHTQKTEYRVEGRHE